MAISWKQTRSNLAQDKARLRAYLEHVPGIEARFLSIHPAYMAVFLNRFAHWLYLKKWGIVSRLGSHLIAQFNLVLTGFDANPMLPIEGGLLIPRPLGTTASGVAGHKLTLLGLCGIGLKPTTKDVGAGAGLPLIGDDVVLGPWSGIIGALQVGDHVWIDAGVPVLRSVKGDKYVRRSVETHMGGADTAGVRSEQKLEHHVTASKGVFMKGWKRYREDVDQYLRQCRRLPEEAINWRKRLSASTCCQLISTGIYRLSHACYVKGWRRVASCLYQFNRFCFKASINPSSDVGAAFYFAHPVGMRFSANAGKCLTVYARTFCGDPCREKVSHGPVLGDHVTLSGHSSILGPIQTGSRVSLGPFVGLSERHSDDTFFVSAAMQTSKKSHEQWKERHLCERDRACDAAAPESAGFFEAVSRDLERLKVYYEDQGKKWSIFSYFTPECIAPMAYRLSRFAYQNKRYSISRCIWQLNVLLTGADMNPSSDIGPGLLMPFPAGVSVRANAGSDLSVMSQCFIGGGLSELPESGVPCQTVTLGDKVYLSHQSCIYGAYRIGDRVHFQVGSLAQSDIPDDAVVQAPKYRAQSST